MVAMDAATTGGFVSLLRDLQLQIFALLGPRELLTVALTSKLFHSLAAEECLWEGIARRCFPAGTLLLGQHYSSYQELVRDDNRANAVEHVHLNAACTWRMGDEASGRFYQCKLLDMEVEDGRMISISFDARGESDLRDPSSSTIAVVSLCPGVALPRPDAATPAATPATAGATYSATPAIAGATASETPAATAAASMSAPAEAAAAAACAAAREFQAGGLREPSPPQPWCYELPREGQPQQEPFQRVIVSARPEALMLCARQSGHYKGIMRWSLKELLPALSQPGRALVFCYACNLSNSGALSYQNAWPDYSSAVLLQTPSDGQFQGYWRQLKGYRVKGEMERQLRAETLEDEVARWASRPEWAHRPDWWPQHQHVSSGWQVVVSNQMLGEGAHEWLQGWVLTNNAHMQNQDEMGTSDEEYD